jgi:hypothetical protein
LNNGQAPLYRDARGSGVFGGNDFLVREILDAKDRDESPLLAG